jgi:uncharacterized pyridoxal phosphate-containing UPF0001 family protein
MGTDAQRYSVAHDWSCPDKQGQIHGSFVNLIHGVDSFKLLKEINKQALKNDRIIDCLLQMHIAEETKFGLDEEELNSIMASSEFQEMKTYELRG